MVHLLEFETYEASDYHAYRLPSQFWIAYLGLRNHLLSDAYFLRRVYGPGSYRDPVARAWKMMDCHFDRIFLDEVEAGRIK